MPVIPTKRNKRLLPLLLAAALSLCACGGEPPAASPAPASAPPVPAPLAPLMTGEGVEVQTLFSSRDPEGLAFSVPFAARDGKLLVEVIDSGERDFRLLGFDLETGEQTLSLDLKKHWPNYRIRPDLTAPGTFRLDTKNSFRQITWDGETVAEYTLPWSVRPGQGCWYGWDALPEEDKLAWTDEKGLWLARADGSGAALVLPSEAILEREEFFYLIKRHQETGSRLAFRQPWLMDGGRSIAVGFGSANYRQYSDGLVVLDTGTGETLWQEGSFHASPHAIEPLSGTTLLAGNDLVDVTTGEVRRAFRWERTSRFWAFATDFAHYFGVEETNSEYRLVPCTLRSVTEAEPALVFPRCLVPGRGKGMEELEVLAAETDRVVCRYLGAGETGLLLVTVTEAGPSYLTPGQGVTCKEVLSWPARRGEWTEAVFAPRDGLVLVRATQRDERLRPARGQLMGVDMKLGEVAFTMPLTAENDVRKVPEDPGGDSARFVLADSAGYTRYIWGKGRGVHEQWSFTLPPAIAQAVADWAAVDPAGQRFQDDWDARWRDDIVTWVTGEGVWVAGGDGNDARLAVSMAEIYRRPRYQEYLELKRRQADAQLEDCLHLGRPRLMNGGNTLVVPIDNRVSLYIPDDLLVIDLATGERTWHEGVRRTGKSGTGLEIVDDTTILAGETTLIHLANGSTREVSRQPGRFVVTVDEKGGTAIYPRDLPSGTFLLAPRGDCRIDRILAEEGDRVLLTCITGEAAGNATTRLVLATLPDKEQYV